MSKISNLTLTRFPPGLSSGPRWGSLRRSPKPSRRLGRGHSLPICPPPQTLALDTFGVSISTSTAPRFLGPPIKIPGYAHASNFVNITLFFIFLHAVFSCTLPYILVIIMTLFVFSVRTMVQADYFWAGFNSRNIHRSREYQLFPSVFAVSNPTSLSHWHSAQKTSLHQTSQTRE